MKVKGSAFFVSALLVCGLAVAFAQQLDVGRELEEAKTLYREAKFAQAIAKLQATIGRLEQLHDLQARKIQLSDAHLHLALSYVALNDPAAAKESLKQMLRADRNRRLDPDIYAPKVIELFEEARKEVAAEPAAAATPPPSAMAKKGGSKAPLILLGAAAAAGGGIAVAKGGGGTTGSSGAPMSAPTPTPAAGPTPAPSPSGPRDFVLIGTSPPPGTTISVGPGPHPGPELLSVTFAVVYDVPGTYYVNVSTGPSGTRDSCISRATPDFVSSPGQRQTFTVNIQYYPTQHPSCSQLPFTTAVVDLSLGDVNNRGPSLFNRGFAVSYTFRP